MFIGKYLNIYPYEGPIGFRVQGYRIRFYKRFRYPMVGITSNSS